jgi:hypothetical protein
MLWLGLPGEKPMKLPKIAAIIVALVGCSAPAKQAAPGPTPAQPVQWTEIFDALWDVVVDHKRVWMDEMQQVDGEEMERVLKSMDWNSTISGTKHGLRLKGHVNDTDVREMTALRRDLKEHPILSRYFPTVLVSVSWPTSQKEDAAKPLLDFELLLCKTE